MTIETLNRVMWRVRKHTDKEGKNKMKCKSKITSRSYTVTQKELKEKLGLTGDIKEIALFCGVNIHQEEKGESHDTDTWEIVTHEGE